MTGPDFSKFIYLAIMGLFVAVMATYSIGGLRRMRRLKNGTSAVARITNKKIVTDDGTDYYVTYSFKDYAGQTHAKEIRIRKKHFEDLAEGQKVDIVHEDGNPDNSYFSDEDIRSSYYKNIAWTFVFGVILCGIAFAFVDQCVLADKC